VPRPTTLDELLASVFDRGFLLGGIPKAIFKFLEYPLMPNGVCACLTVFLKKTFYLWNLHKRRENNTINSGHYIGLAEGL
jgi:hypothetical protein